MVGLMQLPTETLLQVFSEVHGADDLVRLASTCRLFQKIITGNSLLFKEFYLRRWDNPTTNTPYKKQIDWEATAKDIAHAQRIVQSSNDQLIATQMPFVTSTFSSLLRANDSKSELNNKHFLNSILPAQGPALSQLLCRSSLYSRASGQVAASPRSQQDVEQARASAHLHCLYGIPQLESQDGTNVQPYALSKVYDMRQYIQAQNGWGPFVDDGSWFVDWEKMESIMLVLGANIRRLSPGEDSWISRLWADPFQGTSPFSYKPMKPRCTHAQSAREVTEDESEKASERRKLDEQDPYGVTGTYLRIVCFLDYRVLHSYNWGERRPQSITEDMPAIKEDEATRMIAMRVAVDRIEWPEDEEDDTSTVDLDASSSPKDGQKETAPALVSEAASSGHCTRATVQNKKPSAKANKFGKMPIVHFTGTSHAMHAPWDPNANSRMRGTVRMTPEGEVRWTTVSIFPHHEERWKSEGIQIGGIKSGRGVLGTWFDCNYDDHGPAGPTAFWKIRDDGPEMSAFMQHGLPGGGLANVDADDSDDDDDDEIDDEVDEDEEIGHAAVDESDDESDDEEDDDEMHEIVLNDSVQLVLVGGN